MSQTVIHRTPGVILVILASLASGLYLWPTRSVLVPISDRNGTDYVFVSAPIWTLTTLALAALVSVIATHVLVRRLGIARALPQPPLFTYADVAYLSPLLCLAVSTLALLNLQPWFSNLPPLSYAIVDLRWWWTALLLGAVSTFNLEVSNHREHRAHRDIFCWFLVPVPIPRSWWAADSVRHLFRKDAPPNRGATANGEREQKP